MCFICTLLDKSFPSPKQLAKAYFETSLVGVDNPKHYEDIEEKMGTAIRRQGMTNEAVDAYAEEFKEEYDRLKGQGWA